MMTNHSDHSMDEFNRRKIRRPLPFEMTNAMAIGQNRTQLTGLSGLLALLGVTGISFMLCVASLAQPAGARKGKSGLDLPRFVSLKSAKVNMRKGPGRQYPIVWVYRRKGLPVEVVNEFNNWRQVRDSDGAKGWIFRPLLSSVRTAIVRPWGQQFSKRRPTVPLRDGQKASSEIVARLESGVIAHLAWCNGTWCRVAAGGHKGYVRQKSLWGVYGDEIVR